MALGDRALVRPVTATHDRDQRHPGGHGLGSDKPVPRVQSGIGERQAAKLVGHMRVHPGEIENQVRPMGLDQPWQMLRQGHKIRPVPGARRQPDIQIGHGLACGEIRLAVHREGEHARLIGEDRGGAIALVHVQIHHQNALRVPRRQEPPAGDGDIIEHAVTRAEPGMGMVAAARGVGPIPMDAGEPGCQPRAARGEQRPARHPGRDRKTNPPLCLWRHGSAQNLLDIVWAMHRLQRRARCFLRPVHGEHRTTVAKRRHGQRIFVHGEGRARRKRRGVLRMMDKGNHRQRLKPLAAQATARLRGRMAKPRAERLLTRFAPTLRRTADRIAGMLDQRGEASVGVEETDLLLAQTPTRRYMPPDPRPGLILFVHGGGWLMGGPQAHGSLMRKMASAYGRTILSLDYGLAPEVPVDVAFEQVCDALEQLCGDTDAPVFLVGESAGAMMIAHAAHHHPEKMAGLVLVCPILDFTRDTPHLPQKGASAGLVKTVVNFLWPLWSDLSQQERRRLSPLAQNMPGQHPPTLVIAANADPLKMDAIAYAKKLGQADADVTLKIYPQVTHGFFSIGRVSKTGQQALALIGDWIDTHAG